MIDASPYQDQLRQDATALLMTLGRPAEDGVQIQRDSAATLLYLAAEGYRDAGFPDGLAICAAALYASDSPRAAEYLQRLNADPSVPAAAAAQIGRMARALGGRASELSNLDPGKLPEINEPYYRSQTPVGLLNYAPNALDEARPANVARKCHSIAIALLDSAVVQDRRFGLPAGPDTATSLLACPFYRVPEVMELALSPRAPEIMRSLNEAAMNISNSLQQVTEPTL